MPRKLAVLLVRGSARPPEFLSNIRSINGAGTLSHVNCTEEDREVQRAVRPQNAEPTAALPLKSPASGYVTFAECLSFESKQFLHSTAEIFQLQPKKQQLKTPLIS